MTRRATLTIVATSAAAVMIGMDFNGAAVVLTEVERDLGTDLTSTQWMLNLYALTFGMGIVAGGKLGDTYGHRRVLLIGLVIFGAASLGVALSENVVVLIGIRGLQGLGGALIWPTLIAISFNAVPPARAGLTVGIVLGAAGFGNVLGPMLGGLFAELVTWRLLFVVNLPVCLAAGVMVWRLVPGKADAEQRRGLDLRGVTTLALALFALMYSLDVGADWGWTSPGVIALWAVAVVLFVAFVLWEPRSKDPLIPPELLRDRGFVAALLANGLLTPAWFSFFVYVPQYMQKSLEYSALEAGAGMLPAMVTFACLSPLSGRFYQALGPRLLITAGYVATTGAALSMALTEPASGYWGLLPGLVLMGIGAGLTISTAGTAAVAAVDEAHSGSAGGLSFMFHLVIGAAGVAIGTALFTTQAGETATGSEFVVGFHAVMWFCAAVAAAGIINARLIRTADVRMESA